MANFENPVRFNTPPVMETPVSNPAGCKSCPKADTAAKTVNTANIIDNKNLRSFIFHAFQGLIRSRRTYIFLYSSISRFKVTASETSRL